MLHLSRTKRGARSGPIFETLRLMSDERLDLLAALGDRA
jgi:hypothetical protein